MSRRTDAENRSGPRYVVSFPVRAEWDDERSGEHIVVEGETENVGPTGALVRLNQLPAVGSRVQLDVMNAEEGTRRLHAELEVLRLERNPGYPLAALQLTGEMDEWRGLVWEPASQLHNLRDPNDIDIFD